MKSTLIAHLGLILLCFNISIAQTQNWTSSRPDGHAPISIMGDHYHSKGEFMISYRYMPMWMEGNISGSDEISDSSILENFMAVPQDMQMDMHMLGAMYALSDNFTLAVMANYLDNSMDLKTRMGADFTTASSGFSDLTLTGLFKLFNKNRQSFHANFGVSIPTGSIDQRDDTPAMNNAQLAYPMQLGSGTVDPVLGATYLGQTEFYSLGLQSLYRFRLGENSEQYTFGNRFDAVAWGAFKVLNSLSVSASLSYFNTDRIEGTDADMNPMMMPLFDTANSGRSQIDVGLGSNYYFSKGFLKNLRLGAELKSPLYQNTNGIQMQNTAVLSLGVQYSI